MSPGARRVLIPLVVGALAVSVVLAVIFQRSSGGVAQPVVEPATAAGQEEVPAVAEAAAIALPHPKWGERPLLIVVRREDAEVTGDQLRAFLAGKVAKWWLPDEVIFVDELPHTATGKISKLKLRERFADHKLPDAR